MKQYTLFFSWQNDKIDVKDTIKKALKSAQKDLLTEGIYLILDEDTRNRTGNRDIVHEVLEKIKKCDIFLADLTPVVTMYEGITGQLPKHIPNSNVMFEYGYAMHCKGEKRLITLVKLCENEHVEHMPFDINHNTLTKFKDLKDLTSITIWIKKIIEEVDKDRATIIPEFACCLFPIGNEFSNQLELHPNYRKTLFIDKKRPVEVDLPLPVSNIAKIINPTKHLNDFIQDSRNATTVISPVKPINRKTNQSYSLVKLYLANTGTSALENCKLSITSSDDRVKFARSNTEAPVFLNITTPSDTFIDNKNVTCHIDIINPQDNYGIRAFYIFAPHDIGSFQLNWVLSTKTGKHNGSLNVKIEPNYQLNYNFVEDGRKKGTEIVEDLIVCE